MTEHHYEQVANHPKFAEMIAKRNRFALLLSLIVLAVYYGFVAVAALFPAAFAAPLFDGLTWPVGLVAGFVIQAFAFVMTGIYVGRANGEFDAINRVLLEEAGR